MDFILLHIHVYSNVSMFIFQTRFLEIFKTFILFVMKIFSCIKLELFYIRAKIFIKNIREKKSIL